MAAWHFSGAFEIQAGLRKVPGDRNWMLGAFDTRLATAIQQSELDRHGSRQQLELNSQFAYVTGKLKSTSSYATGFSYCPRNSQNFKFTIDATLIDGSPANSPGSDVLVGDDGVLLRAQWQVVF